MRCVFVDIALGWNVQLQALSSRPNDRQHGGRLASALYSTAYRPIISHPQKEPVANILCMDRMWLYAAF